jgi:5-methylcytosine-specific restriction endonuclease McrA
VLGKSKCGDCRRENDRRWYERNADKANENARQWSRDNPERRREAARRWHQENIAKVRDYVIVSETRRRLQPGAAFDKTVTPAAVLDRLGHACHWCDIQTIKRDGVRFNHPHYPTIDHLVPLSKGGAHTWANVVVACRGCNHEKLDDVCQGCGGPITTIGEPLCAKCVSKGRGPKVKVTVWSCGHLEPHGGSWCSKCKLEGFTTKDPVVEDVSRREAERVLVAEVLGRMDVVPVSADDLRRLLGVA